MRGDDDKSGEEGKDESSEEEVEPRPPFVRTEGQSQAFLARTREFLGELAEAREGSAEEDEEQEITLEEDEGGEEQLGAGSLVSSPGHLPPGPPSPRPAQVIR